MHPSALFNIEDHLTTCPHFNHRYVCAGKSTLINAFLGNELLPVNNVPETARICRITHSTTAECPEPILEFKPLAKRTSSNASSFPGDVLEPASSLASGCSIASSPSQQGAVVVVRGSEQIREHLQQLNRDVRSREYTNSDEQVCYLWLWVSQL